MLEALVAIGIILGGTASSLTLVAAALKGEKESEAAIVAANLAREGLEAVRGIRDSNWLADVTWDAGIDGSGTDYTGAPYFDPGANVWSIDFSPDGHTDSETRVHRYNAEVGQAVVGLHVQAASPPASTVATPYSRLLTLNAICDDDTIKESGSSCGTARKIGIQAISEVQWQGAGRTRTYTLEERLYDWR